MATSTSTLAAALVAAQKDMPAIEADATNPHFRNKYVSLDHLLAKALPVLNKHGIALVQLPSHNDLGHPTLTTRLVHTSGESMEADMPLFLPKNDPQGHGSALTYARRYALAAALGISDEKDDDGEAGSGRPGQPARTPSSPEPVRPTAAPTTTGFQAPTGEPTGPQRKLITDLCGKVAALPNATMDAAALEASLGPVLTKQKASEVVAKLQRLLKNAEQAAA